MAQDLLVLATSWWDANRVVPYVVGFALSLGAIFAGLPARERRSSALRFVALMAGCTTLGVLVGGLLGWLFLVEEKGFAVGALGFGVTGFSLALSSGLYVATNHPARKVDAKERPMTRFTAIAIPGFSSVGAACGLMVVRLGHSSQDEMWPFVLALGGALVGTLVGAAHQIITQRKS